MSKHTSELNYLQVLLEKGEISRRDFFVKTAALGISASLATSLMGKSLMAATPKRGGTFRIGSATASTADSLDPEKHFGVSMMDLIFFSMHTYLTETGPKGTLRPLLAETWENSPDAKIWTFRLRRGVEFHNGKTVTAKDVVASINIHISKETKSAAKPLLAGIEDISADGDHTVVFRLKAGNADLPYLLSYFNLAILPAKDDGVDWESKIGAGSYILKKFEPGVSARLERNPNYWRTDRGFFDQLEIRAITDQVARVSALTTGAVDAIDGVDFKIADRLRNTKNVIVEETIGGLLRSFPMLTDVPPFDDNNVRLALKYAVDREAMVKTVLQGHGTVGNDHPIPSASRFFASHLEQRVYDPDKAKFYLKKAGLNELKVDLSAADAGSAGGVDSALLYREHAAKAGITITVIREPEDGYWSDVWMKKPWCACYWGGTQTEDIALTQAYAADAPWNDTHWKHDRFNKLLVEARAELDTNKRREMYWEMQAILKDEGGVVIPFFPNYICATSSKIAHGELEERWSLDCYRAGERWWFV